MGLLLWGLWRGSRGPLLGLVSLFCGSLAAYMLYPLTASALASSAGLPVLFSCTAAASGLFVVVGLVTRLLCGQLVKKANDRAQEMEAEPPGDETFWEQTSKILADRPGHEEKSLVSRISGGVCAVLIGGWLIGAVGLVHGWVDPPFPTNGKHGPQSHAAELFAQHVQPKLDRAPHLALASRLALLGRAANEINRAGPAAVKSASEQPDIQALFREPAIAAALDDPSLVSLIESGNLGSALRHPRLSQLLSDSDARAAIVKADLTPVLTAAERIVAGERDVAAIGDGDPVPDDEPATDEGAEPATDEGSTDGTAAQQQEPGGEPAPDLIPTLPPPEPATYAHGDPKHDCKEGCSKFAPPHGHRLHACDAACPEFAYPHGHKAHTCDVVCPKFQAPHGHRLHDCGVRCPQFVPPHGHRLHACDRVCPEFKAPHGKAGHRCAPGCSQYVAPHGHRLHDCDERCGQFVPPHGHRMHQCDAACAQFAAPHGHRQHTCTSSCPSFVPPHGHELHRCAEGCSQWVAPHGHRSHRCSTRCPDYRAPHGHKRHVCDAECPKFVPPHGHALHACDPACPEFKAAHGHRLHRCGAGCSQWVAPHGHQQHSCGESCPQFRPPHGHRLHACDAACSKFNPAHGKPRHTCSESCPQFVPPHGHANHTCGDACPRFVPPHGHRLHRCSERCAQFVPPHGHKRHTCAPGCPRYEPPKMATPKIDERPRMPPSPAKIVQLYAASNPYSLKALDVLRPGQPFAFRARIELSMAQRRDVKKTVRWKLLDPQKKSVRAFARAERSPAVVGARTSYVAGQVPGGLPPGKYTLQASVQIPGFEPDTRSVELEVAPAPLLVREVRVCASPEPDSKITSASAGVTVYLRATYAVRAGAGGLPRRLAWQVTDDSGRALPQLEGSKQGRGAGEFALTEDLELPADMAPGTYWFQFSVEAGGEIAEGQATLTVRAR